MEQVHHQWVVEEEEEQELQDATALEGRQSLHHRKDSIIATGVGLEPTSSSSSSATTSNGHSNGVCSASVEEPLIQKEEQQPPTQNEEEPPAQKEEEPPIQKEDEVEEMGSVENGNHLNHDCAAVGLGLVAEFVGDATNGEAIHTTTINVSASQNKNSVYFDKQEEMWKCHHCTWTKRIDSPWNMSLGNLGGYSDLPRSVKTMIQRGPCFVCETKGNEVNGLKGVQNGDGARSVLPKSHGEGEFDIQVENSDIQNNLCNEVNNQCMKTVDDKVPFSSELSPLQNSSEVQATTVENFGDESNAKAFPNLIKEIDQQLEELDVEAVLSKQETHDLFCPNCKSCITKRVILRKRKRNIHNLDTETKPDKSDTKRFNSSGHEANQGGHAIATSDVGSLEPPADNYESEREPEVFRCLSCFSFFIPLRNGIKLFPNFGGAREPETSQNPLIIPASNLENPSNATASNANWFISLFTKKGKKASEQGDASVENSRTGPAEQLLTENVKTDVGEKKNDSVDMIKTDTVVDMSSMSFSDDMVSKSESVLLATASTTEMHFNAGKPAKDALMKSYEGSLILKKSQKDVDKAPEIAQNNYSFLMQEAQSLTQSFGSAVVANDIGSEKQSSGVDATIPSDQDFKKVQTDIEEEINPSVRKENKEAFKSSTPETADNVSVEGAIVTKIHTQIYIGEQPRAEIDERQEWEILKSIVYGGLIESITSLGIVSSATGSGAAPLNIIALGLANLIGGLFIIVHNLIELKNDHSGGDPQQMNMQEDRYRELLGRRANFLLHAVVAVLSFLIFGSVPVVIYGLLIRKNYYAEVKLAAVAATSVVCIILLAIGKVYTTRPPKSYIKTVLHYVTSALAASGVSFIVGELLNHLLEKFSRSESGFVLTIPFSGTRSVEPAWMSY